MPANLSPVTGKSARSLTPSDPEFPQLWNLSRQLWPQTPQVLELPRHFQRSIKELWTTPVLPSPQDLAQRAAALLSLAIQAEAKNVLVAGPTFLAAPLVLELELARIKAWHPFGRKLERGHELLGIIPALPLTEAD